MKRTRAACASPQPPVRSGVVAPVPTKANGLDMTLASVADVIALSDERDMQERRRLADVRTAYLLGAADGYRVGYERGARLRVAEWPEIVKDLPEVPLAELELRRWGPGGREQFGNPRAGDHPGGSLPHEHEREVHLGGPACHWHQCTRACRAYRPGWYSFAAAARILATLPQDGPEPYGPVIAKLLARAEAEAVAA